MWTVSEKTIVITMFIILIWSVTYSATENDMYE